jgi:hypothetical protein
MEVAAQIALYAKLLKPGGALLGLPGSMSEKVKGVTLRCSYRRQAPGLIAYDLDFDVGDLIKKLVNAV